MKSKFPDDSKTIQTDIVLPGDTNSLNNLLYNIYKFYHKQQLTIDAV